jgi:GTP pyrophosphokinase
MKRKQLEFDQVYDLEALRVILEPSDPKSYLNKSRKEQEEEDRTVCYQVLGAVHNLWQPIPREFDDYIANPKANGYQSLHTAVLDSKTGQRLEVQIRTLRMHEEAERGVAAHWAYKEQGTRLSASIQRRIQTLRGLLATLQDDDIVNEGSESLEIENLEENIQVITPIGDVVDLPYGATPIDFAYQIHTEIGHRCRGARVNGKLVSLDYKLKRGDRVEILTAKRGGPNRDWMNPSLGYTANPRTRSKIRHWFRQQEREQNIAQGREVIQRELRRLGLGDSYTVQEIAKALKYKDVEDFLAKVGFGDIQSTQISGAISLIQHKPEDAELLPLLQPRKKGKGLVVKGVSGLYTRFAGCCNPIPPDPIVGYITRGSGITIHHRDCPQLANIRGEDRKRLIDEGIEWGSEAETHPVPIVVRAYQRPGLLEEMINFLRAQKISVPSTKTLTANSIVTIYMIAEITDLKQLEYLLTKFENLPNVIEARRQSWS